MKFLKIRSWVLGVFMFVFGALKLMNPFAGWFHVQLINSGIGDFAFPFGVGTEIIPLSVLILAGGEHLLYHQIVQNNPEAIIK